MRLLGGSLFLLGYRASSAAATLSCPVGSAVSMGSGCVFCSSCASSPAGCTTCGGIGGMGVSASGAGTSGSGVRCIGWGCWA